MRNTQTWDLGTRVPKMRSPGMREPGPARPGVAQPTNATTACPAWEHPRGGASGRGHPARGCPGRPPGGGPPPGASASPPMPAGADPTGARGPGAVVPDRHRTGARGSEPLARLLRPEGRGGSVGAPRDPTRAGVRAGARGRRTPAARGRLAPSERKRMAPAARRGREGVEAWKPGSERGGIRREWSERGGIERVAPAPVAEGRARACGYRSPCDRAPSSHQKGGDPMGRGAARPGAAAPLPFDASPGSLKIEGPRVPLPSHPLRWIAPSRHTLETGHVEEGRGT